MHYKANQSILLVPRPPIFKVLCGWAVIIHYSICHFEGAASWNHPKNKQKEGETDAGSDEKLTFKFVWPNKISAMLCQQRSQNQYLTHYRATHSSVSDALLNIAHPMTEQSIVCTCVHVYMYTYAMYK